MENEARRKREETEQKPGWQEARIYDGMFHQKNEPHASKVLATRILFIKKEALYQRESEKNENHIGESEIGMERRLKDDGVNMDERFENKREGNEAKGDSQKTELSGLTT